MYSDSRHSLKLQGIPYGGSTEPAVTRYDAIILGSGQAGNPLASALFGEGQAYGNDRASAVGGTCVNYGCTPTKTMVASAELAYMARRALEYGIKVGEVSVDMPAVRERKNGMVKKWREGSEKRLRGRKACRPDLRRRILCRAKADASAAKRRWRSGPSPRT